MTPNQPGTIAEYGSQEFQQNQSVRTVLQSGYVINGKIARKAELYHRTAGYKPAGSCAIWTNEAWGYTIYWDDVTMGKIKSTYAEALEHWNSIVLLENNAEVLFYKPCECGNECYIIGHSDQNEGSAGVSVYHKSFGKPSCGMGADTLVRCERGRKYRTLNRRDWMNSHV